MDGYASDKIRQELVSEEDFSVRDNFPGSGLKKNDEEFHGDSFVGPGDQAVQHGCVVPAVPCHQEGQQVTLQPQSGAVW